MLNLGSTLRAVTAEETLAHVEPLLFDKFGITRVVDITGLDNIGLPVFLAVRPTAKSLSVSQGKGTSKPLAKISAIMESIELWHAENILCPTVQGSYHQLRNKYPLFNLQRFMQDRLKYERIDDIAELEMHWIEGEELNTGRSIWIPFTLLDLNFARPHRNKMVLYSSSNGLASGNTLEEASCHALYELIERDRMAKKSVERIPIDLNQLDNGFLREMVCQVQRSGAEIILWFLPDSIEVPVYDCLIQDKHLVRWTGMFGGHGAHLSHEIAAIRAVTEAIQSRLTLISGARDDLFPSRYNKTGLASFPIPMPEMCRPMSTTSTFLPTTFSACMAEMLRTLKQHEMDEVIRINLTRPDLNIPVVFMLVPGLQHALWMQMR